MRIPLNTPILAGINYVAIEAAKVRYDMDAGMFRFQVYGVASGEIVNLNIVVGGKMIRIEEAAVSDAEIDAEIAANPELNLERIPAAVRVGIEKLYKVAAGE